MERTNQTAHPKSRTVETFFINSGFCMETRFVCFLNKMAADEEVFGLILSNFLS